MDPLSRPSWFSEAPWGFYLAVLYNVAFYLISTFALLVVALVVMFISWRRSTFIEDVERSIVQLVADFAFSRVHLATRFISWINGYHDFAEGECNRDVVVVSICTNGLGHVHQAIRVLSVLKERSGFVASVVVVAKMSKLPPYARLFLEEYGAKEIIDLNFELDYEGGGTGVRINNFKVILRFFYAFVFHGVSIFCKVGSVFQQYRPAILLSFFEPILANFVNSHDSPIKIITAASQGSLSAEKDDIQRLLFLKLLWHANVGKKGRMIPFCQYPLENAIPQIVKLPKYTPLEQRLGRNVGTYLNAASRTRTVSNKILADTSPFYVAYSCMPGVLLPGIFRIKKHRVLLFTKNHTYWAQKCCKYKHVTVLPRSPDFINALDSSVGLISQPSRGVVTQAIALGKPVYLFCPQGHVEQELNLKLYLSQYDGIGSSSTISIEKWEQEKYNLASQAQRMRTWLNQTDDKIMMKIGSYLPLSHQGEGFINL